MIKAFVVVILLASVLHAGDNLVVNGSFEDTWPSGALAGWSPAYEGYALASNPVLEGRQSIMLSGETASYFGVRQNIENIPADSKVTITSHVYVADFKSGMLKPIHLSISSGGRTVYPHINVYPGDIAEGEWTSYTLELDMSRFPGASSFTLWVVTRFRDDEPFSGTVYYDDISVVVESPRAGSSPAPSAKTAASAPDLPELRIPLAPSPPELNGKLTDPAWEAASVAGQFLLRGGEGRPASRTSVKLLWDENKLYLGLRSESKLLDPDAGSIDEFRAEATDKEGSLWRDDHVEVFIAPGGSPELYKHFALNAIGTAYEGKMTDGGWSGEWEAACAIHDGYWVAEISIPWSTLDITPGPGLHLRANFFRADVGSVRQFSAWSPVPSSHHNTKYFGNLYLEN